MRVYSCPLFRIEGDSGFSVWHDEHIRGKIHEVIRELLVSERRLARKIKRTRKKVGNTRSSMRDIDVVNYRNG